MELLRPSDIKFCPMKLIELLCLLLFILSFKLWRFSTTCDLNDKFTKLDKVSSLSFNLLILSISFPK